MKFSIVWPSQPLHSIDNFLHGFPEKLCFSFQLRHTASSSPLEFDLSIDSLDEVPSSGIGAEHQFHEELRLHFASSILFCPIQTALQTTVSELRSLLGRLDQLSFQRIYENISMFGQNLFLSIGETLHIP